MSNLHVPGSIRSAKRREVGTISYSSSVHASNPWLMSVAGDKYLQDRQVDGRTHRVTVTLYRSTEVHVSGMRFRRK